ncbi:NAD(P)/FAD-dependent oxidoreductase [Mycolicibacterium smegmatis]|uniref:NAD(P)/FAD-dependent oxidoreductase n=1 Tax=Mycolicibacterium smegmatis TaxID=1772 RepID=UPI00130335F1|nr:FAD-dependent oxidoreductase [Mycolicibacterium smegmatis]
MDVTLMRAHNDLSGAMRTQSPGSEDEMTKTRVAIVGAGTVGLSAALHLARSGKFDIIVLEAEYIAEGSSSRSIGIVETQYMDEFDIAVRAFGLRFVEELVASDGLHFNRNGYLRLGDSDEALERYACSVDLQKRHGIDDARVLGKSEIKSLVPHLEMGDRAGGLYGPSDGYLDGHLFANLMGDIARRNGATIMQKAKVLGATCGRGEEIVLDTTRGPIVADVVVNAAGGWAGRVGELLDAPVTMNPQRHQAITVTLNKPLGYTMTSVMDYVPGSGRAGLYFRHENKASLFAGLHTEETIQEASDPDSVSYNADEAFTEQIAEALAERLPGLEGAGLGRGWAGMYPMSFDQQPVVGPHPADARVYCALGAGGNGIQLAPAIGKTVAEYLEGVAPSMAGPGSKWDSTRIATSDPALAGVNLQGAQQ